MCVRESRSWQTASQGIYVSSPLLTDSRLEMILSLTSGHCTRKGGGKGGRGRK